MLMNEQMDKSKALRDLSLLIFPVLSLQLPQAPETMF